MRAARLLRWLLIATYASVWIGGAAHYLLYPHTVAPAWAPPVFLVLATALALNESPEKLTPLLFGACGFVIELMGLHTGFPFGRYSYTAVLGPAIGGVPVVIAGAWLTLLAFSQDLAARLTAHRWKAVVAGAAIMTAADLLIDPVSTSLLGFWHWESKGPWFGIPLSNFAGWFAVSALLLSPCKLPSHPSRGVLLTGASILLYFAVVAAAITS